MTAIAVTFRLYNLGDNSHSRLYRRDCSPEPCKRGLKHLSESVPWYVKSEATALPDVYSLNIIQHLLWISLDVSIVILAAGDTTVTSKT